MVEGRGSTEVWQEGQTKKHTFEWQKGSMFSIPLNAYHRFINAASSPALLLCGTSAPNMMNLVDNADFIFNCPHNFTERFSGADDFFKPKDDLEPDPVRGLAMRRTNFIPDIINTELPLDNRRSPGYRRVEPQMAGNRFYLWIGQHETGRYSKAHKHASAAVLICVKGKGYTYTWPEASRHAAVEGRQGRQGDAAGLRAGRHGDGRADGRRLVPPAFRRQQGSAASHRLVRHQQFTRAEGRASRAKRSWTMARSTSTRAAAPSRIIRKTRRSARNMRHGSRRKASQSRMNPEFYERPPEEGEEVLGDVM